MSAAPTIGVLALQGDVREHLAALTATGVRGVAVRRPSELDSVDALIIPGGESTTIAKLAIAFDVFEPVRERLVDGMPAYGSCAGMILLADQILDATEDQQTFGGLAMTVRRNAFGRQIDSFEGAVEFAGFDQPLHGVFIRAPWVEEVTDHVQVLGRVSVGSSSRIVAVQQGALMATSFHPELTGDYRVHEHFVNLVRDAMTN